MRSWLAKKLGFLSNTRRVQHEVDATKVLLLTELFRRHRLVAATGGAQGGRPGASDGAPGESQSTPQRVSIDELLDKTLMRHEGDGPQQSLREWLSSLSHEVIQAHARQNLHTQVVDLLASVKALHDKEMAEAAVMGDRMSMHDFVVRFYFLRLLTFNRHRWTYPFSG